ncbi:MAG: alpha amylase catalytic region, partial [Blastococcus sp.]|jgi:glycosidase|nr:alpha amylase catalytic region [Blastococcus sp.]
VLKNARPEGWKYNYHGYGAQDFLNLDERFGTDGTRATAELELTELVEQAHARGIRVILDIVLNHAARVFDYVRDGGSVSVFTDESVLNAPLGAEPHVRWLNGYGQPRADWEDTFPPGQTFSGDDAVYPEDLRRYTFFRRRGKLASHTPPPGSFVIGDFEDMRQLVFEYTADSPDQADLRRRYGPTPVLSILVRIHSYLIARYDLDGLRIDTAKYVSPVLLERFGNAIREYGHSIGKHNLFTFGEIADSEETIAAFVGRNGGEPGSFGIDAALDFPLAGVLGGIAKGLSPVEDLRGIFQQRKDVERELLSSHGEAGRFFVTFLDNHDRGERFQYPGAPPEQVTLGLACLFCLPGIPAVYYGTEQSLQGTVDASGKNTLGSPESVREALWGKPGAFDRQSSMFTALQALTALRASAEALRYGRLYFRELSGNGQDFGHSSGWGGVVAFSRILGEQEVTVVANCSTSTSFRGFVLQDPDLNARPRRLTIAYSNLGSTGAQDVQRIPTATFYAETGVTVAADVAALPVSLAPMEAQILIPQ